MVIIAEVRLLGRFDVSTSMLHDTKERKNIMDDFYLLSIWRVIGLLAPVDRFSYG